MSTTKELNQKIMDDLKRDGMSHGLEILIQEIEKAKKENRVLKIYFSWVTNNRLSAYIIVDNELQRLWIPEAGHRLYANYKDGYQVNGGGYNKPFHVLENMVYQVRNSIISTIVRNSISDYTRGFNWQDYIKAEVIN